MPLHSTIDPSSSEFAGNADVMRGLVAELRDKLKEVSGGGGELSRKRYTSRVKMLAEAMRTQVLPPEKTLTPARSLPTIEELAKRVAAKTRAARI